MNKFEKFDYVERYYLHSALLIMVRENSGNGFHNSDQGHPDYLRGRCEDIELTDNAYDNPNRNNLYKLMRELSESLKDSTEFGREDLILKWSDFCKMATDAYNRAKGYDPIK